MVAADVAQSETSLRKNSAIVAQSMRNVGRLVNARDCKLASRTLDVSVWRGQSSHVEREVRAAVSCVDEQTSVWEAHNHAAFSFEQRLA